MSPALDKDTPWISRDDIVYTSAFKDNIRAFLSAHGAPIPDIGLQKISCWKVALHSAKSTVVLQVYEERLNEKNAGFCDPCRIIGKRSDLSTARSFLVSLDMMPRQSGKEA